jgi:uncharacterized membrane protein
VVETLAQLVEWIALAVEAAAVLIIAFGATQALAFVFDPRQRQLGAIALIRTFLSYFLERDIRDLAEPVPAELSSGTGRSD